MNVDDEKTLQFASGTIYHFDPFNNEYGKPCLYFDGTVIETNKHIKRNIKLSRFFKCYDMETGQRLYERDYPKKDKIYKANIKVETWEWNGNECMRVLALELGECAGYNDNYKHTIARDNPFVEIFDLKEDNQPDSSNEGESLFNYVES